MKARRALTNLSRRERQIMDVIYREGQATATEVLAAMPDPPSYSAVRAMLRVLENKGHLRHVPDGTRYVYRPDAAARRGPASPRWRTCSRPSSTARPRRRSPRCSTSRARSCPHEDLDRLSELIEQARTEGR